MTLSLLEIVQSGLLPEQSADFLPLVTNDDGTYLLQEGTVWDFKETWPFSYSDGYFFGICRLICAFGNTEGGLIIFGVDDSTRRGGRTKTIPNVDRLEQAFEDATGQVPSLSLRRYQSPESGDIDVLLVRRKSDDHPPFRFIKPVPQYPKDVIFIRKGSSVRAATSNDINTLYLTAADEEAPAPKCHLPPSPATVREFVGRMSAIDRIFTWLRSKDEPRAFLYGKGGSGKSTIAYQVFKSIDSSSGGFIAAGNELDILIFISAKGIYLDVESQSAAKFVGLDFQNEEELYAAILTLSDYDFDSSRVGDLAYLRESIEDLFYSSACFVVIDDIDTLSTLGKETGMDFLYGVLWRSRKRSKILYTLRNRPSHSISNSLEVPGLAGEEFDQFVDVCANQFGVPSPTRANRDNLLWPTSEGRPLVVESILAIRRTTSNYTDAVALFETEAGNEVRDYVFRREWDALDPADRGREVLAIIALYGTPIAFDDIVTISRLDSSKVRDAIASVQEIFLTNKMDGDDTVFSVGSLTRSFVIGAAQNLNLFETIRVRVDNFRNTFYPDSPALNTYTSRFNRAEAAARRGETSNLVNLVTDMDGEKAPRLREDPRFLSLRATARLMADYRSLPKARADFEAAMDFKYSPPKDHLLLWLRAEKHGDSGDIMTRRILDRVSNSKGYDVEFKARVKFERACHLYSRGRSSLSTAPHQAVDFLKESVLLHVEALADFIYLDSSLISKSQEFSRNTCFVLAQHLQSSDDPDQFLQAVRDIGTSRARLIIDPLVEPLYGFMRWGLLGSSRKDVLQRRLGRFEGLVEALLKANVWCEKDRREELKAQKEYIKSAYRRRMSSLAN